MYKAENFLKIAEVDDYLEGCDPDTATMSETDLGFRNETLKGLLTDIADYFGAEKEDLLLNSCEEDGRLDIQIMENNFGDVPTSTQIEQWKVGERQLWAVTYTTTIEKVETVTIPENVWEME